MLLDSYITECDHELIQKENCYKITKYSKVRKNVRRWYELFGFLYPHTSENNFRDGWFHYRKLYKEHSTYEVASQAATLDEHLQRAEKDSMVFFFQKVCELLEFWYFVGNKKKIYNISGFYLENVLEIYDHSLENPNSWVKLLKDECNEDIIRFSASCIYVGENRFLTNNFIKEVQQLLHDIKNNVLEIRMGGAQIARISEPGEYNKIFESCFEKLVEFVNRYRIIELLSATDVIEMVAENKFLL